MSSAPIAVSVVIGCHQAAAVIGHCLQRLVAQAGSDCEIIVATTPADETAVLIRARFPTVQVIQFAEVASLPLLRGRAIARAKGAIIAILDPYSLVAPNWLHELKRVHAKRPFAIIGGAVNLHKAAAASLLTWAKYINEYGMFMLPMSAGEMEILPGSNISYKRALLFANGQPRQEAFWKTFVNWEQPLWFTPNLLVYLHKPIPFAGFLRTRFDHGRCFADMRANRLTWAERLLRAGSAPLLPAVFLWRWGQRFWRKQRYRRKFVATFPLQLLLFGWWAVGEGVGYLRGSGDRCDLLVY